MSVVFQPASELVKRLGVKAVIYGPPGSGKTPLMLTAPNPCLIAVEPGLLSIRKQTIPTTKAFNVKAVREVIAWLMGSKEVFKYNTIIIDSISQLCEIILEDWLSKKKDGRAAYGELSVEVMRLLWHLYFLEGPNIVLIAKQGRFDDGSIRPWFPGQDLNTKVPHLFDEILHLDKCFVPEANKEVRALRCQPVSGIIARDRSGNLGEFEQPNLSEVFRKVML